MNLKAYLIKTIIKEDYDEFVIINYLYNFIILNNYYIILK